MNIPHIPAGPAADQFVAVIDTREQIPLNLEPLQTTPGTLATGDYTVLGLESIISIERKSESDMLSCIGADRERFDREVQRLLAYPTRALVVESTWANFEAGVWRSRVKPEAAIGSLLGWSAMGLPIVMAGDHTKAGRYVSRMLFIAARRRCREARALIGAGGVGVVPKGVHEQASDMEGEA
jgi:DNA excision repair protein ERCC-4